MRKEAAPEERLLRLIKGKRGYDEKPAEAGEKPAEGREKSATAKGPVLKNLLLKLKINIEEGNIISNLSRALIFLLIGVCFYFIFDSLLITPYRRYRLSKITATPPHQEKISKEKAAAPEGESRPEPEKPYSYYSKDIAKRDIFKPMVQKGARAVEEGVKKVRESLSLTGIISGKKLQAAIEDKTSKKTYFVYKGEYIDDILVEDILENKVILNYRGETFELTL